MVAEPLLSLCLCADISGHKHLKAAVSAAPSFLRTDRLSPFCAVPPLPWGKKGAKEMFCSFEISGSVAQFLPSRGLPAGRRPVRFVGGVTEVKAWFLVAVRNVQTAAG
jgi:hypothetical protein